MSKELEAVNKWLKEYLTLCEKLNTNQQERMLLNNDSPYNILKTYFESIDNSNPSEALECLEKILNKVFGYGVQFTLDSLLLRGYNTKNMLEQECLGKTLEQDLDEAKTKIIDLKGIDTITIKRALLKAKKQEQKLDRVEKLTQLPFKERRKIGEKYIKWCENNNAEYDDATTMITWALCFKLKEVLNNE